MPTNSKAAYQGAPRGPGWTVPQPTIEVHDSDYYVRVASLQDQERVLITKSSKRQNSKRLLGILTTSTQEIRVRRRKPTVSYLEDDQQVEEVRSYHIQPSCLSWCLEFQVIRSAHQQMAFKAKPIRILSGPNERDLKQIFFDRDFDRFRGLLDSGAVALNSCTADRYSLLVVCFTYSVYNLV